MISSRFARIIFPTHTHTQTCADIRRHTSSVTFFNVAPFSIRVLLWQITVNCLGIFRHFACAQRGLVPPPLGASLHFLLTQYLIINAHQSSAMPAFTVTHIHWQCSCHTAKTRIQTHSHTNTCLYKATTSAIKSLPRPLLR